MQGSVVAGHDVINAPGGIIQAGQGSIYVTNTQGIPAEQFQHLAEELGVTKAALTSFFKILEQQHVPPENLDAKLREIATHYKMVLARVRRLSADDPHITKLRDAAEIAVREEDFDRAEQLLDQASQGTSQQPKNYKKSGPSDCWRLQKPRPPMVP